MLKKCSDGFLKIDIHRIVLFSSSGEVSCTVCIITNNPEKEVT